MTRNQLSALFVVVIAASYICNTEAVNDTCDPWSGPAGNTHCVKFDTYSDYQWATCRTNIYIQTKSKGRHICTIRHLKYCYYQCMIDVHNEDNGGVLPDCKCSPGEPVPTESVPLPSWCYSPDGKTCNWYRECLNKAYPQCENDENDYAIKFAEKFCKLYDKSYSWFSLEGQKWVDAVRKCLQVKLVPLVDTTHVKTCEELRSTAFESHTPCYLNPDGSSLSYCDLSLLDQGKVFWTIKSAFDQAFWPSIKGLSDVGAGCTHAAVQLYVNKAKAIIEKAVDKIYDQLIHLAKKSVAYTLKEVETRIKTWLEDIVSPVPIQLDLLIDSDNLHKFFNQRKRSIEDDRDIARSKLAGKILDAVALEENWKEKGVAWFGYANNETASENNLMSIRLVVADHYKYEFGSSTSMPETKAVNLTTTLVELSEAVLKGTLNIMVDGESIKIMKMNGCLDWDCDVHAFNITALKLQENNGTGVKGAMFTFLQCLIFLVINILFIPVS